MFAHGQMLITVEIDMFCNVLRLLYKVWFNHNKTLKNHALLECVQMPQNQILILKCLGYIKYSWRNE